MYITTPSTNTHPPTAGMMLLATIDVGGNMKALELWWPCDCMSEGVSRHGNGASQEHCFVWQRMLCMPTERDILERQPLTLNEWHWELVFASSIACCSYKKLFHHSTTSPPPHLPHQCHHLLPYQASERATSLLTLCHFKHFPLVSLPKTWSAWNNIKGIVLLWYSFWTLLSLPFSVLSLRLSSFPPSSFNACSLVSFLAPSFDLSSL